jgi:hypothetical protein
VAGVSEEPSPARADRHAAPEPAAFSPISGRFKAYFVIADELAPMPKIVGSHTPREGGGVDARPARFGCFASILLDSVAADAFRTGIIGGL